MPAQSFIDSVPLWLMFAGTALLLFVAVAIGALAGRSQAAGPDPTEAPFGTVVGAIFGLSAFVLAFTFSMAAARFDQRREALLDEANAIGTAYLRAAIVAEPHATEVRRLLREYVDLRVEVASAPTPENVERGMKESQRIQDACWSHAVAVGRQGERGEMESLFVAALNDVFDIHAKRFAAARLRIPPSIWWVLYVLVSLSAFAVGFQFGRSGRRGTAAAAVLALAFSSVVGLVADLDRSAEGFIRVDQTPMLELQASMK